METKGLVKCEFRQVMCVCWKFLLMIVSFNLVALVWSKIYGRILGQELTALVSQKFLHLNAFNCNSMIGFKDKTRRTRFIDDPR